MRSDLARLFLSAALAVLTVGCTDLSEYRGRFEGGVVGADDEACPVGRTCSFIRRGFPDGTRLILDDFRPPPTDQPIGTITTTDEPPTFDATALELIVPLEHDQLSLYDFPGGGRVQNFIFAARPATGPLAGRDAMVFVSLMQDDSIELRVICGSGDETLGDHFGLFELEK